MASHAYSLRVHDIRKCQVLSCRRRAILNGWNCWEHHSDQEQSKIVDDFLTELHGNNGILRDACLDGIKLAGAELSGCQFVNCSFTYANFNAACLRQARFEACSMENASFVGAILDGAALTDTHLRSADFGAASLAEARLDRSDLTGANFARADLSRGHAPMAIFNNARMTSVQLCNADFSRARMGWARLDQSEAEGANFGGANLAKASFIGTVLSEANFARARLRDAVMIGAKCTDADFRRAELKGCHLESADLTYARFHRSALSDAHLEGADVAGLDLDFVGLTDVDVHRQRDHVFIVGGRKPEQPNPSTWALLSYVPRLYWAIRLRRRFEYGRLSGTLPAITASAASLFLATALCPEWTFAAVVGTYLLVQVLWLRLRMPHAPLERQMFAGVYGCQLYGHHWRRFDLARQEGRG